MSKLAQNKTVLITGASTGVGEVLACTLAREGAKLILISEEKTQDQLKQARKRTAEKCKSEGASSVDTITCDLADSSKVQSCAEKLAGKGIDVALMNAGVFVGGPDDPLKGNPDEWDRMFKVNALAPMRLVRQLAPKMCDKASTQGSGWIICIGDVEAVHTGPSHAAYAASKYALRGFCKSAYEALRDKGVHVMNIAAGNVRGTAMAEETAKQGGQGAIDPQDIAEAVLLALRVSPNCVPEEINLFRGLGGKQQQQQPQQRRLSREEAAVSRLLAAIEGCERGLAGSEEQQAEITAAVGELKELGSGSTTTAADDLSATWRLLWTTEKETLFILEKAGLFGTQAGDVYQVIDVNAGTLQNVITFPPEGAFIVDSTISISSEQRTDFKFSSATLRLPKGRRLRLPPFGQGWFDTIYVDDSIRVAQDVRGDTLVVAQDGPPRRFE
ncbi:hypothetical protein ABPG75_013532 [Micractinium tetrahymenae]